MFRRRLRALAPAGASLRRRLTVVAVALFAVPAIACGDYFPKRGGQMNSDGGEIAFELVTAGSSATFFLEDHGQPIPTATVKGTLKKQGAEGWTAPLAYGRDNRLTVRLPSPLRKGDRLVVDVAFANGSIGRGTYVFGEPARQRWPGARMPGAPAATEGRAG